MLSIIIPTCNRNQLLSKCLVRLAPGQQTLSTSEYEVIVTDDSPSQGSQALCLELYPWVRYTIGPRKGPAANRNHGAKLATGEWLVFLDDDCIPDYGILQAYKTQILQNPDIFVFEGAISPIGLQIAFNEECPINETGGCLWSCNFCIKKCFFQNVGCFEEAYPFPAMEDVDLRLRVNPKTTILFCAGARVSHPWKKVDKPFKKFDQVYFSHKVFLDKWPDQRKKFGLIANTKKAGFHLLNFFFPNFFAFRGVGISYVLGYYLFLFRLSIDQLKRRII